MKISDRIAAAILFTMAAVTAGCGGPEPAEAPRPTETRTLTQVAVVSLEPKDLQETFSLPATLEAWEDLVLGAEVDGTVRWVGPKEGEAVARGEALLRIDPDIQKANLAQAEAQLAQALSTVERYRSLAAQNLVSRQQLEETETALAVARTRRDAARLTLEKSTLTSPVDGVLDAWFVDRGEYVSKGTAAAAVVAVDRLKALVNIPEKDVAYFEPGQTLQIRTAAMGQAETRSLEGRVLHIAFRADPVTRTYLAKVEIDNRQGRLRPGMILRVVAVRRSFPQALAIPIYALLDRDGQKVAFVEDGGVARLRPVVAEAVVGEEVVIASGLAAGERLIVKGQQLVSDGSAVAVAVGAP